jgi:CRISPR-associated protein Cas2
MRSVPRGEPYRTKEPQMLVVVTYDVSVIDAGGPRRLRRVAKTCENYGQRVQYSVFECLVEPAQFTGLKHQLTKEIDPMLDSLRFYFLGKNWKRRIEHIGAKSPYDPEGTLIV